MRTYDTLLSGPRTNLSSPLIEFAFAALCVGVAGHRVYGLYEWAVSIVTLLSATIVLGAKQRVADAVFRIVAGPNVSQSKVGQVLRKCLLSGLIGLLVAFLIWFQANLIATSLLRRPEVARTLTWLAALIPLQVLTAEFLSALQAKGRTGLVILARDLLLPLGHVALILPLLAVGWRLAGMVATSLAVGALGLVISLFWVKGLLRFPLPADGSTTDAVARSGSSLPATRRIKDRWELFAASVPAYGIRVCERMGPTLGLFMVGLLRHPGEVGLFALARAAGRLVSLGPGLYSSQWAQQLVELYSKREIIRLERTYKQTFLRLIVAWMPAFLLAISFADPLLGLFGPDLRPGVACMLVIGFAQLFSSWTGAGGRLLAAIGRTRVQRAIAILSVLFAAVLDIALIPRFGITGAAVSEAASIGALALGQIGAIFLILGIHPFSLSALKGRFAAAVSHGLRRPER